MLKLNSYLIDYIPEPILRVEANYNVIWANAKAMELKSSNPKGNTDYPKCYELIFEAEKPCSNCALVIASINKGTKTTKSTNINKSNEPIYIESTASYIPKEDEGDFDQQTFVVMCKNITRSETEKIQKEEEIKRHSLYKARPEVQNDANHTILSRIAKDLRSNMNGVMGMAQLLRSLDLDESASEYVYLLNESCRSVNNVIATIEESSKVHKYLNEPFKPIENGKFKLSQLVNEINPNYMIKAEHKNLELEVITDKEIPDELYGDYFNLYQILSFSLENAILNSKSGIIRMEILRNTITIDQVELVIKVEFGKSSSPSLDDSYCDLNNIKKYVELIDGKFMVHTNSIMMYLPFGYERTHVASTSTFMKALDFQPKKDGFTEETSLPSIIVADADVTTRLEIKSLLKSDYDVHLARTGKEALELYERLRPKILIIDILLPEMDGFEVLDVIDKKKMKNGAIIAFTERVVKIEPEYLSKYGFDDYLSKPVKANILKMVIDNNLNLAYNRK